MKTNISSDFEHHSRLRNNLMNKEEDEPLTPAGRLFLSPQMNQIISCAIGVKNPINTDSVKSELTNSIMLQHPRFTSLLVNDSKGKEHWRKTEVNVDQHLIIRHEPLTSDEDDEDAVNDYLADLAVSCPLPTDKPLWELHLLMAHKCFLLRVHHALGDGISLMSMFLTLCRRVDDPGQRPTILGVGSSAPGQRSRWGLGRVVKVVWYTVVFLLEFVLRTLWWRDRKTAVSGGAGVELWPRKLATAKFKLDDMKIVKKAVANTTINDILFGVLSSGLSKYLEIRSTKDLLPEGLQITGVAMVNLREQSGLQDFVKMMESKSPGIGWGNKFGMILIPVCYHKGCADPLQFVRRAKAILDKKKLSLEAICSYKIGDFVMSFFGPKLASLLNYRILSNTTFTISNVIGPQEEITIVGNPIDYIRANNTSLPHALMINMLSYAGKADMQILVAKDIIPDPKVLAKCFEDSLIELKDAAEAAIETNR